MALIDPPPIRQLHLQAQHFLQWRTVRLAHPGAATFLALDSHHFPLCWNQFSRTSVGCLDASTNDSQRWWLIWFLDLCYLSLTGLFASGALAGGPWKRGDILPLWHLDLLHGVLLSFCHIRGWCPTCWVLAE